MKNIISDISNKEYNSASEAISEALSTILEKKMVEMKKMIMAKEQISITRNAFDGSPGTRAEKFYRDVLESEDSKEDEDENEDDLDEAIKDKDKHFESQSQKMQDAINLHLRKGKDYAGAVKAAKVHVKEELDEARIAIVKARVRGGVVQRRKKVSNVAGYTFRGGQLKRMSPMERRKRKLGQRRGKIKRRAKLQRSLVKRKRSLRKRQSIGLK